MPWPRSLLSFLFSISLNAGRDSCFLNANISSKNWKLWIGKMLSVMHSFVYILWNHRKNWTSSLTQKLVLRQNINDGGSHLFSIYCVADLFGKTLMLGKIAGRKRRGWQRMRWLDAQWMWVWVNSGSWWWTGKPGVLRSMGSPRVGQDWVTELNWTELFNREFHFTTTPEHIIHLTDEIQRHREVCVFVQSCKISKFWMGCQLCQEAPTWRSILIAVVLSHVWLFVTPVGCNPPGSFVQGIFPDKKTSWGDKF